MAPYDNATQPCNKELLGVSQELSRQEKELNYLLDTISRLENKLSRLLKSNYPEECSVEKSPEPDYSEIAMILKQNNTVVLSQAVRIDKLISRIDL